MHNSSTYCDAGKIIETELTEIGWNPGFTTYSLCNLGWVTKLSEMGIQFPILSTYKEDSMSMQVVWELCLSQTLPKNDLNFLCLFGDIDQFGRILAKYVLILQIRDQV